jgi:hypothetical protein
MSFGVCRGNLCCLRQTVANILHRSFLSHPSHRVSFPATIQSPRLTSPFPPHIFNPVRYTRDSRVRYAVRERDAPLINEGVLTIIVIVGMERLAALRKTTTSLFELSEAL